MIEILFLILMTLSQYAWGATMSNNQIDNIKAKVKIAELVAKDQTLRHEIQKLMVNGRLDQGVMQYLQDADQQNTLELKKLISCKRLQSFTSKEEISGIWLLSQHSDHDLIFQQKMLHYFKLISTDQPNELKHYAYLYDRVQTHLNLPQRYGTQGFCAGKHRWVPFRIENKQRLNQLRHSVSLNSFAAYQKIMNDLCS